MEKNVLFFEKVFEEILRVIDKIIKTVQLNFLINDTISRNKVIPT